MSPAGRLSYCNNRNAQKFAVDGGYIESSGAEQLMKAWPAINALVEGYNRAHGACVVPVFVQLDNGYDDIVAPAPIKNPNQVLLPLTANRITGRSSREQIAKIQAAMTFGQPYPLQTAGPSGPVPITSSTPRPQALRRAATRGSARWPTRARSHPWGGRSPRRHRTS